MTNRRFCFPALALLLASTHALALSTTQRPAEREAVQARPLASTAALVAMPTTLLVQDVAPWDTNANETILNRLGVPFAAATASELANLSQEALAQFTVIVVASDQPQDFYDLLAAQMDKLGKWVKAGPRTLEFHGADMGWSGGRFTGTLPKGVTSNARKDYMEQVLRPKWSLMKSVPTTFTGSWASHDTFNFESPIKAIVADTSGGATLLDYCWKPGRIIVTGLTLEVAWAQGWAAKPVLENLLAASTSAPGCQKED